jgi:hypothetical protein
LLIFSVNVFMREWVEACMCGWVYVGLQII